VKLLVASYITPPLLALDLAAKLWARQALEMNAGPTPLLPGLSLRLVENPGISFGIMGGSPLAVTLLTGAIIAMLLVWFIRSHVVPEQFALGFILAGAMANLIDRMVHGSVTDFLVWGPVQAPLFTNNLADIWITIGVILLFGGLLLGGRTQQTGDRST
jgi:signal peptidase II